MKAMVIDGDFGLATLRMVDRPDPVPQRGQVIVRVRAASLNYRDLEIVEGRYHTGFALPLIPLSDGVGEVAAVGPGVTRVKPGDRVAGTFWQRWVAGPFEMAEPGHQLGGPIDGLLAELAVLDEQGVVKLPDHLTDAEAASLPCAAVTAWHALVTEGGIRPGDWVLVQGTGGVAIFGLQIATLAGARVIVTSSSDEKLARAAALGAAGTVNYRRDANWAGMVRDLTGGRGVDHVLEVGGPGSFAQSLAALRPGGQINVIGYLGGTEGSTNPLDIFRRQARVRGIPVGHRASFEALNRAIATSGMRPVIDRVFAWTDAAAAFHHLKAGAHFGKVALTL